MSFTFATSDLIMFGPGKVAELPALVARHGERPLVVTGAHPERHADLLAQLPDAATFAVSGEPTLDIVRAGAAAAREQQADVVIGLGGGSVIDAAKIIATLVTNGGDPLDYAEVIGAGQPITEPSLPCIAIPTTAGTGSEVTANGVVASPEHGVKVSLRARTMIPTLALIDPELALGCPPAVTAASGLDALTQCLEPFVSHAANPLTDGLCREGLSRAARGLRQVYHEPDDRDARTDMAVCALMGGLALANAKLGAVHGFAGPLGGMISAPHGALCAALLPAVCEANLAAMREREPDNPALARYDEVAHWLTGGSASAEVGVGWIRETVAELGVPGLTVLGLTPDRYEEAATKAAAASSMKGNPMVLTHDELLQVLAAAA